MKKIALFLVTIAVAFSAFAEETTVTLVENNQSLKIEDLFLDEIVQELNEKGELQRNFYGEKNISLELAPKTELGIKAKNYWQRKDDPVFIVESLYLLNKKDVSEENSIEKISKILTNLSEMTGIEYYSNSREIWEELYTDVHTVNNEEDKVKIPDPVTDNVENLVSYIYQKDRSLSGTVYEFSYFSNENEISFRGINTENIKYKSFTFPIVRPDNLVLTLIATDVGDSLVFYVLVQADVPKIPFVSERLARSFSSRADAIFKWCLDMYNSAE